MQRLWQMTDTFPPQSSGSRRKAMTAYPDIYQSELLSVQIISPSLARLQATMMDHNGEEVMEFAEWCTV